MKIRNEKEELLKVQKQLTDSMKETEFAVHTITDKLKRIQEQEKYLRKKRAEYEDESIETENEHVEEVKQRIPDIATTALDILAVYQKEKKKKKNQISKEMVNMQIQIYDKIHGIASKREYADEYFKKTFDSLLVQTKQPLYLSQQFEINRISYENQLEKLKIDLAEMDQEQKNIEVREVPITWAQVSANSGGEGFLSAFVVLSCLLSYMRRDETDLFSNGEEGKVLIMDNPFAQTNAEHLLKPLMEMAKKTNTQLICLSGLGGDSIYNRFDNIYVLKLVDSGIRKGVQRIESRHIKGDGIREVVPSEFRVEQI